MLMHIDNDYNRFRQIIKGKIKDNLRKYISSGEMIGRKGKDLISIPLPQIDIPRFRFGENGKGYMRLSYAASEDDIREALKRMKAFIEG